MGQLHFSLCQGNGFSEQFNGSLQVCSENIVLLALLQPVSLTKLIPLNLNSAESFIGKCALVINFDSLVDEVYSLVHVLSRMKCQNCCGKSSQYIMSKKFLIYIPL
jgi:hypothetical protein